MSDVQTGYDSSPRHGQPGTRVMADGRTAPELVLVFKCPKEGCEVMVTADAYLGPLTCHGSKNKTEVFEGKGHAPTFMEPQL